MQWRKITLIGVGLLGGSLGMAIRERGLAMEIAGYVRRRQSIAECQEGGAVTTATTELSSAVDEADLVVFCTPLAQMRELAASILPLIKPGVIVTDVGSVKASVVGELEPLFAQIDASFIGSHPMAGGEAMGVKAARADLFCNAICVVTPTEHSRSDALARVEDFWRSVGARPVRMSAQLHDELVSRSSHLPHAVAATLAKLVLNPELPPEQALLCANGFRDTTRVASGSPEMWRDISMANREFLLEALDCFMDGLKQFRTALQAGDRDAVEAFFKSAKQLRDDWRGRNNPEE